MTVNYYNQSELNKLLELYSIPNNSIYYKVLKEMVYSGAIADNRNLFNFIKEIKKESLYRGISCMQALELTNILKKSEKYNDLTTVEHKICGLIIDTWNISKFSNLLGDCSCYYMYRLDNMNRLSRVYPVISLAFSGKNNKKNLRDESTMYSFWITHI